MSSKKEILKALMNGRRLSQMDCREFEIEDMRTIISHLKEKFSENNREVCSRWILTPKGRSIKEYWLKD